MVLCTIQVRRIGAVCSSSLHNMKFIKSDFIGFKTKNFKLKKVGDVVYDPGETDRCDKGAAEGSSLVSITTLTASSDLKEAIWANTNKQTNKQRISEQKQ